MKVRRICPRALAAAMLCVFFSLVGGSAMAQEGTSDARKAFAAEKGEKADKCTIATSGSEHGTLVYDCPDNKAASMAGGLARTCQEFQAAGFTAIKLFGAADHVNCVVNGEGCKCEEALALDENFRKRLAFVTDFNAKGGSCAVSAIGDDAKGLNFTCADKKADAMAGGFKATCNQYQEVAFATVEVVGEDAKMTCTVDETGCNCGEKTIIPKPPSARQALIDGLNGKSGNCKVAGEGDDLKTLNFTCDDKVVDDMAAGLKVTCENYAAVQFDVVALAGSDARMTCKVADACECSDRVKIPKAPAVRQAFVDDSKKSSEGCEVAGSGDDLQTISYNCPEKDTKTMSEGFLATCDKYQAAEFSAVELAGADGEVSCTVSDEGCECASDDEALAQEEGDEEEELEWFPAWGVGLQGGFVSTGLNEINDGVLAPSNIENIDTNGLVRVEAVGGLYITKKVLLNVFFGGANTQGGNTTMSLSYGGIEPAMVFPEDKVELILGVRLGLGSYIVEGLMDGSVEGAGYSGLAGIVEPGLTIRYAASEALSVDVRFGFKQFIARDVSSNNGAAVIEDLGASPLDFSAPTVSVGFTWGKTVPREAKADDAEGDDAEGDDAEGDDAEGDDAEGDDAEGDDAEGDDAEGDE